MFGYLIALAALIGAASDAHTSPPSPTGDRYRLLTPDSDEAGFLDETSIKKSGQFREFWVLLVYASPVRGENGKEDSWVRFGLRVNCQAWTVSQLYAVAYTEDGHADGVIRLNQTVTPIGPDSNAQMYANYVCKGRLGPSVARNPLLPEDLAIIAARSVFAEHGRRDPEHGSPADAQTSRASPAADHRYRLVAPGNTEAGFVDEDSVKKAGQTRDFWVMVVFAAPIRTPSGKEFSRAKYQVNVDCQSWTGRKLNGVVYTKDGRTDSFPLDETVQPISPGSHGEAYANYACKGELNPSIEDGPLVSEDLAISAAMRVFAEQRQRNPRHR